MRAEEIERLRSQTPGLATASTAKKLIHFDNAGCSLPTACTLNTVTEYLQNEAFEGGYTTVDNAHEALEVTPYRTLATLLHCDPDEIAIVTSATEAWQQIIYGLAASTPWKPGDRLLTSVCEYGSNYIAYLQLQKRYGIVIEVIPENEQEDVDIDALRALLLQNDNVVLVSINHIPTSSGRVYNIEAVGTVVQQYRQRCPPPVFFLVDACQSVGQMPVDVHKAWCDFLTGTGRKYLRGPRGTGFLYCARRCFGAFEPATLDNTGATWVSLNEYKLKPSARRFERYEMCFAAKAGLGVAVQQVLDIGIERIWERIRYLGALLRQKIAAIQHSSVTVQDKGASLCGIVTFTSTTMHADALRQALGSKEHKINVTVSRSASSRIDFERRGLQAVVRASVHYYNTEEEIERFCGVVSTILAAPHV